MKFLDPKFRYKVIFMNRDLTEIVKSQQKMINRDPDVLPTKLFESYNKHLALVENWKDTEPGVELIYVDYPEVLKSPSAILNKIEAFIGLELDKEAMESCIDKSLYRTKA